MHNFLIFNYSSNLFQINVINWKFLICFISYTHKHFIFYLNYNCEVNITWHCQVMAKYKFTLIFIPHPGGIWPTFPLQAVSLLFQESPETPLSPSEMSTTQILFLLKFLFAMSSTYKAARGSITMSLHLLPLQDHQCPYQRHYVFMLAKPMVP